MKGATEILEGRMGKEGSGWAGKTCLFRLKRKG